MASRWPGRKARPLCKGNSRKQWNARSFQGKAAVAGTEQIESWRRLEKPAPR
jgi:hypothetical protein